MDKDIIKLLLADDQGMGGGDNDPNNQRRRGNPGDRQGGIGRGGNPTGNKGGMAGDEIGGTTESGISNNDTIGDGGAGDDITGNKGGMAGDENNTGEENPPTGGSRQPGSGGI